MECWAENQTTLPCYTDGRYLAPLNACFGFIHVLLLPWGSLTFLL